MGEQEIKFLEMFKIRKNFDRVGIFSWIFFFSFLIFLIGAGFKVGFLGWIGGIIVLVYLSLAVLFIWSSLR